MISALSFNSPFLVTANGGYGDTVVSYLQPPYMAVTYRNGMYCATRAAATIPVVAAAMVSQFFLYNPIGSGIVMSLMDINITQILSTTVVDTFALYTGTTAEIAAGTFTTPGTVYNRKINGVAGVGAYYSAYTHSGTPSLRAIIGGHGATTNSAGIYRNFNGSVMLSPGQGVSIAASTAASTTNGVAIDAAWTEFAGS